MATSSNLCMFSGYLGQNAEVTTAGETPKAILSLAVDDSYKDKEGNKVQRTVWPRIEVYGAIVPALAEYLVKGKRLEVMCKYEERTWVNEDGEKQYYKGFKIDQGTGSIILGPDPGGNGNGGNLDLLLKDLSVVFEAKDEWKQEEVVSLLTKLFANRKKAPAKSESKKENPPNMGDFPG